MTPPVRRTVVPALALVAAASFAAPPARAVEPLPDLAAFDRWASDALNCRGDFLQGVQDRAFLDRLAALGVVETTPWQEGDIPEGELVAPRPIRVGGQPATRFKYWADSGSEFYAIVASPPAALAAALDAKSVPPALGKEFDARTVAVRFLRSAAKNARLAPAVFVRRAETGDASEVGCRTFDG